jgi:hypothetical protein
MSFAGSFGRKLGNLASSEEDRRILAVPTEPNPVRLWRVLAGTVMLLWSTRMNPRATFYFDLEEVFGNDYRPKDGFRLAIKRGDRALQLKIDWSMVWVSKNILYVRTDLHPGLIDLCESGSVDELEVEIRSTVKASRPKTFRVTAAKHESSF